MNPAASGADTPKTRRRSSRVWPATPVVSGVLVDSVWVLKTLSAEFTYRVEADAMFL